MTPTDYSHPTFGTNHTVALVALASENEKKKNNYCHRKASEERTIWIFSSLKNLRLPVSRDTRYRMDAFQKLPTSWLQQVLFLVYWYRLTGKNCNAVCFKAWFFLEKESLNLVSTSRRGNNILSKHTTVFTEFINIVFALTIRKRAAGNYYFLATVSRLDDADNFE